MASNDNSGEKISVDLSLLKDQSKIIGQNLYLSIKLR